MKLNIDTFNYILEYIIINQKMTKDGILEKLPISDIIEYPSKAGPESTHYHVKLLADDECITVERNGNGVITAIIDVNKPIPESVKLVRADISKHA